MTPELSVPRIEELNVKNYRALRDLELKSLTPLRFFLVPMEAGNQQSLMSLLFCQSVFSLV